MTVTSKIVHTRENSFHSWSQLSSDNGEIGSQSRLYQPEAFWPACPGLGLSTKNNFCFFPFFLGDHSLLSPHDGRDTQSLIERFHRSNSIVLKQALQITTLPVFASNDQSSTSHSLSAMRQLTYRPIYTVTPLSREKRSFVMSRVDSSHMPLSHLICLNRMRHDSCICDTTHSSVT